MPGDSVLSIVKRMFWLAYQSSHVLGMGKFQARADATEEDVWNNILTSGDYPARLNQREGQYQYHGDYVFGRMIKLFVRCEGDKIVLPNDEPDPEYQGWAGHYKTYQELLDAALSSLAEELVAPLRKDK